MVEEDQYEERRRSNKDPAQFSKAELDEDPTASLGAQTMCYGASGDSVLARGVTRKRHISVESIIARLEGCSTYTERREIGHVILFIARTYLCKIAT